MNFDIISKPNKKWYWDFPDKRRVVQWEQNSVFTLYSMLILETSTPLILVIPSLKVVTVRFLVFICLMSLFATVYLSSFFIIWTFHLIATNAISVAVSKPIWHLFENNVVYLYQPNVRGMLVRGHASFNAGWKTSVPGGSYALSI